MNQLTAAIQDKVRPDHRDRLAVVYIRQSTPQQVEHHQESARLQYALVDYAMVLGWPRERILVIDEDQGRSAASSQGRLGFQHLVAEVGLGRVGVVLGVEMSRLARSCCDWHQLLEICALRDTLLGDSQGIYDANSLNDRLLLGLKGTISEAELHLLKARMNEGRWAKAQRGELAFQLPRGYLRGADGSVMFDPDEQVQATIRLVFTLFERLGSVWGVLRYLVDHDLRLPDRRRTVLGKGELEWRRPNRVTLVDMLHHPIYAGVYVYGRRSVQAARRQPGRPATGRRRGHDLETGVIVLRDRIPAYISWDQYMANQEKMAANRSEHLGVPRHGPALLSGLLVCGRCGRRMLTVYRNNGRTLRYLCCLEQTSYGAATCQSLTGRALDDHVTDLVLQAVTPPALETSLQLAEDLELERAEQHRQWRLRLERALRCRPGAPDVCGGGAGEPPGRPDLGTALGGGASGGAAFAGRVRALSGARTGPPERGGAGRHPASGRGRSGSLARAHHNADRSSGTGSAAAGTHCRHGDRDDGGGHGGLSLGGRCPDPD